MVSLVGTVFSSSVIPLQTWTGLALAPEWVSLQSQGGLGVSPLCPGVLSGHLHLPPTPEFMGGWGLQEEGVCSQAQKGSPGGCCMTASACTSE